MRIIVINVEHGYCVELNIMLADTQICLIPKVQDKDNALMTNFCKNRRKIEETIEAILDQILIRIETFYEKYNCQLNSLPAEFPVGHHISSAKREPDNCFATANKLQSAAIKHQKCPGTPR